MAERKKNKRTHNDLQNIHVFRKGREFLFQMYTRHLPLVTKVPDYDYDKPNIFEDPWSLFGLMYSGIFSHICNA
jgi:hypothetical protein